MQGRVAAVFAVFLGFIVLSASGAGAAPVPYLSGRAAYIADALPAVAPPMALRQDITRFVQFSLDKGWLSVRYSLPSELRKPAVAFCKIEGSSALWGVRTTQETPDGISDEPIIALSYRDAGSKDQPGHTQATVFAGGDYLAISALMKLEQHSVAVVYRSHRDYRTVQVEVYRREDGETREPLLNETGDSLRQIYDEHGAELDRFLLPILKKLTRRNLLGPNAADVYAIFSDIPADPGMVRKLETLLVALDDPDPAQREQASTELSALGPSGVLAAMRHDEKVLSPEQKARLAAFIDSHRQRRNLQLARNDLTFLTQCLEHDELAVRRAALLAIEDVVGRKIAFEPDGSFDTRAQDVVRVRKELENPPDTSVAP